MMKTMIFAISFFAGCILFSSCKKELSCEGCADKNQPPIANAGADQKIVLPKDSVLLDGSASLDADGTITSYKWLKISGPVSSNIINSDSSKTTVNSLAMGVYQFELNIKDNGGLSAKDTVQVIVNPAFDDSLTGQEFIFKDLIWTIDVDSAIYASVDKRPDVFLPVGRAIKVSIKLDTSTVWIDVPAWSSPIPPNNGYLYNWSLPLISNPYQSYFFQVTPVPYNFKLEGTKVSIKVKFL